MLEKIISGGQTGADQGGLSAALILGLKTGGTATKGYRTEKGNEPGLLRDRYGLTESPDWRYPARTKQNVQDSEGTVWVGTVNSPGYFCTANEAKRRSKLWVENPTAEHLAVWVDRWDIRVLNVAGNRESKNPGIHERTKQLIVEAFATNG